jgi:hypothetical protein
MISASAVGRVPTFQQTQATTVTLRFLSIDGETQGARQANPDPPESL